MDVISHHLTIFWANLVILLVVSSCGVDPDALEAPKQANAANKPPYFTVETNPTVPQKNPNIFVITVSDSDSENLVLSLVDDLALSPDADKLVVQDNGLVIFKNPSSLDVTAPGDANGDNIYDVTVALTDGVSTVYQKFSIRVSNENVAPQFTSESYFTVAENLANVTLLSASDNDKNPLSFTISNVNATENVDAGLFQISSTNQLSFISAPNFEKPSDVGGLNVYHIVVEVYDGSVSVSQNITVTVINVNDPPIWSAETLQTTSYTVYENTTATIATLNAVDEDGDALTYYISGGAQSSYFELDQNTHSLRLAKALDYETLAPNNILSVSVGVRDNGVSAQATYLPLSVTLLDVNEPPITTGMNLTPSVEENTNQVISLSAIDPEGVKLHYSIDTSISDDHSLFSIDMSDNLVFVNAPDFETGKDLYLLNILVSDGVHSVGPLPIEVHVTNVQEPPIFDPTTVKFTTVENTMDTFLLSASDSQGSLQFTYSITGGPDAALFSLAGNQLQFKQFPDYENDLSSAGANHYELVLTAVSAINPDGDTSQTISIDVQNTIDQLATGFGSTGTGVVTHDGGAGVVDGDDVIYCSAVVADASGTQKILAGGYSKSANGSYDLTVWRMDINGNLDTTFGNLAATGGGRTGVRSISGSTTVSAIQSIVVMTDASGKQKILAGGYINNIANNPDALLLRLDWNGDLDTSFGNPAASGGGRSGMFIQDGIGGQVDGSEEVADITVFNDVSGTQKILAAGFSQAVGYYYATIWGFDINGDLDTSFGEPAVNGIGRTGVFINKSMNIGSSIAILVDESGTRKILLGGRTNPGNGNSNGIILRLDTNGDLDTSFGNQAATGGGRTGVFIMDGGAGYMNRPDNLIGIAVMTDTIGLQKIIASGSSYTASFDDDAVVLRLISNGDLDTSFGSPSATGVGRIGKVARDLANGRDYLGKITVMTDPSGVQKILVIGSSYIGGTTFPVLWKLDANGDLDTSFGEPTASGAGRTGVFIYNDSGSRFSDINLFTNSNNGEQQILISGQSLTAAGTLDSALWKFE